ncbi:MAG TPA: hypothetical protein PKE47_05475 [Verrucomicrobiota bacterium]|nr:hypothetical protein [Verrucomicrobiota bacterium]
MSAETALLAQSVEQLERMNRVLEHLRNEVLPRNPRMFALLAEGPLDEIQRLHDEIAARTDALTAVPA